LFRRSGMVPPPTAIAKAAPPYDFALRLADSASLALGERDHVRPRRTRS